MRHQKIDDLKSKTVTDAHILLTGGGTLGPVTPLLAVVEEWREQGGAPKFSWIGTKRGH
jgi:UDP-N-acetylglucosamine:LPS N-acetylglucosamine transferase